VNEIWKNRIVGQGEIDPEQLLANPRNWRIHPEAQQEALQGSLEEVGWVDEVTVNKRTGFVIDGHLRVALALRHNQKKVPVKYVDLSEEEEMLILMTLDPITGMAVMDAEKMQVLINEVAIEDERLGEILTELKDEMEARLFQTPTLDELEAEYGELEDEELWPILRFKVSPEVYAMFMDRYDKAPGDSPSEKIAAMLK